MKNNVCFVMMYILTGFIDLYIIIKYMQFFLGKLKVSRKAAIYTFTFCYLLCTIQYIKMPVPVLNAVVSFVQLYLMARCYEKKKNKIVLAVIMVFMFEFVCELMVSFVTGGGNLKLTVNGYYAESYQLVSLSILQIILYFIITSFKNINSGLQLPVTFNIAIIILNLLFLVMEMLLFMQDDIPRNIKMVSVVCITFMIILIMYLYDVVSRSYVNMIQAQLFERENMYYTKQAEVLQKNNDNIRKFRHDINNHLYVLETMLDEEANNTKVKEYIAKLVGQLNKVSMYSSSGNIQLDSIVNYKLSEAREKNIEVTSDVTLPNACHIDMNDMVTILGNIIDNSIEAVEKLDKGRYIDLKIKYQMGTILIDLKNSYDGHIKLKDGTIKTLKRNSIEHGIGLKSVEEAVEKYDGAVKIDYDNNEFRVKIVLYIDEQK
ncbi:sensor histidine kinase [Eubacterium sp. MSJ-13]|uniref:sensor histidine kinase n=1 Tax=Eubacterium sp. MSJ-13 TaxID=2841513 RepID=UPI001C105531|nr:sensor histidine kinase [Eubacterium sp. MSJ-13]